MDENADKSPFTIIVNLGKLFHFVVTRKAPIGSANYFVLHMEFLVDMLL